MTATSTAHAIHVTEAPTYGGQTQLTTGDRCGFCRKKVRSQTHSGTAGGSLPDGRLVSVRYCGPCNHSLMQWTNPLTMITDGTARLVIDTSPAVDAQQPAPTVTESTEGDTEAPGMDDVTVTDALYEHLDATQASLNRLERRAEQLRRDRLVLARALVEEGESVAGVAARLGVSKQYLHKQLQDGQKSPQQPNDPMF